MTTDTLLSRLDRVKETAPDSWLACCPSHDDKNPSLSIRETDDGRILIHCFAGCGATDVVTSVGLEMHDLYPNPPKNRPSLKPTERWIPRVVIRALGEEVMIVVIAASALAAGKKLTDEDTRRLLVAARRFYAAAQEVGYA